MQIVRYVSLSLIVFSVLAADGTRLPASGRPEEVQVRFSLPATLTLHEPVVLRMSVANELPHPVTLDLGRNSIAHFRFSLTRPSGATVQANPSRITGAGGVATIAKETIPSAAQYSQQILLNNWFSFEDVGQYRVDVTFRGSALSAAGANILLVPAEASLSLRVLPRNEQQLRDTCEHWLQRLQQSQGWTEASEAAIVLSSINDPIAIDYLRAAIAVEMMVASYAIDGLRRIGTAEAERALEDATRDRRPTVVELAKAALTDLRANR